MLAPKDPSQEQAPVWHALSVAEVLQRLDSATEGLSASVAAQRLAEEGPNALTPPDAESACRRFFRQFHSVLIYVLLVATVVTAGLGHWLDAGVILAVVLVNTVIGFFQEQRAAQALAAIRDLLAPHATVWRDGHLQEVEASTLVRGDVVQLVSGDRVPADLRLLQVHQLRVDEAIFTGESHPVAKNTEALPPETLIAERRCCALAGTMVTVGQGLGVVIATGDSSEVGQIGQMVAAIDSVETPLTQRMARFGRWLTLFILSAALLVFFLGIGLGHLSTGEVLLASVTLAVAAIPEGLPAMMTVALAVGVRRMAERNAIVRQLSAVEALGSVTTICSDKTGTLTRNELTVSSVLLSRDTLRVSGVGYSPHGEIGESDEPLGREVHEALELLVRAGLLCNEAELRTDKEGAWMVEGDPTEGALLALSMKAGVEPHPTRQSWPRLDVLPFESERRIMASLHHDHAGHHVLYVKGAPEEVLRASSLTAEERTRWLERAEEHAAGAERLLALALHTVSEEKREILAEEDLKDLTFLGMVGMLDPPREEAVHSVAICQKAGIRVKMITGDHPLTAQAIGRQLGLMHNDRILTGVELNALSPAEFIESVGHYDLFARTSPEHKLRIVQVLREQGEVVAMTGDGVNDAPALKQADVGVAMGIKGSQAATEAAAIVLADDQFSSIERAVEEGRTVYENLTRTIRFFLPVNGGESGALLVAILLGTTLPVSPIQVLWINLVSSSLLSLSFVFSPPLPGMMERRPRARNATMLPPELLLQIGVVSLFFVIATFGSFNWVLQHTGCVDLARTTAVNTLVSMELAYMWSVRNDHLPLFAFPTYAKMRLPLMASALTVSAQLLFVYTPWAHLLFHSRPLSGMQWLAPALGGLALYFLLEIRKIWRPHSVAEDA